VSQARAFGLYLSVGGVGMVIVGCLALASVMRAPDRQNFRAKRGLYGSRTMGAVGLALALIIVGLIVAASSKG